MDIQKILDELRANSQIHKVSEGTISRTLSNKAKANDPHWRENTAARNTKMTKTSEWHEAHLAGVNTETCKENMRRAAQRRVADEELETRRLAKIAEVRETEEYQQKHRAGVERTKNNPEWQERVRKNNQDPERRARHSATVTGKNGSQYKGDVLGTNIETGETVRLCGAKAIKAAGFTPPIIYRCLAGQLKSHKGYTWVRLAPEE